MQQNKKPYKIANFGYPKMRLNLVIEFADSTKKTIVSNNKWSLTADGAIRAGNEYDGEIYDARKELGQWTLPGYDDSKWMKAERTAIPSGTLRGDMTPGMKVVKELKPKSVKKSAKGFIIDMGQNMAGWLKLKIGGTSSGDSVKIVFAEKLDKEGNLNRTNLRHAISTDYYIANGKEKDMWWHPTFTYHGFRYAEVTGLKSVELDDAVGQVISDEMEQTGFFECSDTIINKVYNNAVWGILGNYKGMPVDCPQRDERQPWLGDRTRGCFGEAFVFDNNSLYAKWARDITEAQREDGCIPDVAPAYWNYYSDNITWPAALPFSVEMMLKQYGDDAPLRRHYDSMKRWMQHMSYQYERDSLMPRDKYGDWCVPPEDIKMIHSRDPKRQTDGTLIASAYYYRLNELMAGFAARLGKDDDNKMFHQKAARVREAFNKRFLTVKPGTSPVPGLTLYPDSTHYGNNTVTANLLPLAFNMIGADNDSLKGASSSYVRRGGEEHHTEHHHTQQGSYLLRCDRRAVANAHPHRNGRADIAWLLAGNRKYPSWGYMTEQGATTIWELWNGDTASEKMNSGNHVMLLGDLVSWLYEDIAGIEADPMKPGFKHIIMRPAFNTDEINHINASYKSVYGNIVSRWEKKNGLLKWHIEIPANTSADIHLPDGDVHHRLWHT